MMTLLRAYFKKSYKLFSENAEYLFFIGKILHVAEWYFGLSDTSIALEMQKKAFEKEPYNLLYRWSYRLSVHNDLIADYYAYQLLTYEKDKIKWLIQKGFPGKYMLEQLQQSCQRFLGIEKNSLRTTDLTTDTTL